MIIVGLILLGLSLPGCRDDPERVEQFLVKAEEKFKRDSVLTVLKASFLQKSFLAYIMIYMFYQAITYSIQASIPYLVRFILSMEARSQLFLQNAFLIGALVSIPLWIKMARKLNNTRKLLLIACGLMIIFTIPLTFYNSLVGYLIGFVLWGISLGGFWILTIITFADVIDDLAVKRGKREVGVLNGIRQFFARLAIIIQSVAFAVVHSLTGFEEGASVQSSEAILGIQFLLGIIPAVFVAIGGLIFWRFYEIYPDKVNFNKNKLRELKL